MIRVASKEHRGKYSNAQVGTFRPQHPEKYKGPTPAEYKSRLEYLFMRYADSNPSIVEWGYESLHIKYLDRSSSPAKVRRYFIDFVCKVRIGTTYRTVWVEIKPKCETVKPKSNASPKTQLTWIKNQSKWDAASKLARQKGFDFRVLTEEELT